MARPIKNPTKNDNRRALWRQRRAVKNRTPIKRRVMACEACLEVCKDHEAIACGGDTVIGERCPFVQHPQCAIDTKNWKDLSRSKRLADLQWFCNHCTALLDKK